VNVIVRIGDAEHEVSVEVVDDSVTAGDLTSALTGGFAAIAIDGCEVHPSMPLSELGLGDGSRVEFFSEGEAPHCGLFVEKTPGGRVPLGGIRSGVTTIGSAPADVELPGAVGRIVLHVDTAGRYVLRNPEDLAVSIGGTKVRPDGTAVAAGDRIAWGGRCLSIEAGSGWRPSSRCAFNRPPRLTAVRSRFELEPPRKADEPAKPMRFGWGALVVPLFLGIGMAVLIHPRMAVFALFSPAMLLANWFEDRRRSRREKRRMNLQHDQEVARFVIELGEAHSTETRIRRESICSIDDLRTRVQRIDPRLWERRPAHEDFMAIPIGTGCVCWEPPLAQVPSEDLTAAIHGFSQLHDVPISIDLRAGEMVGVAGERRAALSIVRHLIVQAAVHHGPADVSISVLSEHSADWDWVKWLPHVNADTSGRRRVATRPFEIESVVALLGESEARTGHVKLLIVDLPDLASRPAACVRDVLRDTRARGVSVVAVARRLLDLPSQSTTVVAFDQVRSRVRRVDGTEVAIVPRGASAAIAREIARGLARIRDPEVTHGGSALPAMVHLASLLGLSSDDLASAVAARWSDSRGRPMAPIGYSSDGAFVVDFVSDGPHALLGGTTGAGKSELLRSLVAGLAASVSPDDLNFVLVDYKGGSAFDACAALPHTVGLVTDLDEHLAKRALVCLEAELRYREKRMRLAGVSDIVDYPGDGSLPRLLVVVDEFAALAVELPDFMDALVGIAQRGRSLGVHLVLATQRPNGVISDNIKANTNLRISLRVQDVTDSVDVIGTPAAAEIGRGLPGRGMARRGPAEVTAFQAALVTGTSLRGESNRLKIAPFILAHEQPPAAPPSLPDGATTDLEAIVEAAREAASKLGVAAARSPWPDPLPSLVDMPPEGNDCAFGLADEPHRQRIVPANWTPDEGNLLLYGLSGSGTTTALSSIAVALAGSTRPDQCHLHILDFDDQRLAPLDELPHVGSVISVCDRERQVRLLRRLAAELQVRRDSGPGMSFPDIVTMIDNYAGFSDAFNDPSDMAVHNMFTRLVADGPGVGIMTIITAKQPGDVPPRVASLVANRLVFKLADRYDYSGLGVPPVDPPKHPGRAYESGTGREIQVALPQRAGLQSAIAACSGNRYTGGPWRIDVLPRDIRIAEFIGAGRITSDEWFLPLGIGDASLLPAGLVLRDGEHALVTGPSRSGKTTALDTIARVARAANPDMHISVVMPRQSSLALCPEVDEFVGADAIDRCVSGERRLVLVDDAELIESGERISNLIKCRDPRVRVVAAGSTDALRRMYSHWTQDVRRSRIGCALRPNTLSDGDLWQTQLPRHHHAPFPIGRGYLLSDGQAELVHLGRG